MPVETQTRGRQPGFQGSETSSAEMIIYPNGVDPILNTRSQKAITFSGRYITDDQPSLISVGTRKRMNGGGAWTATVKDGRPFARDVDLRDQLVDDDWVDISFKRHNKPFHVLRGLLGNIERARNVSGTGATAITYTLTGRDFGWIWEKTPLWFNKFITPENPLENVVGATAMQVFNSINIGGTVDETIKAFLFGFLRSLSTTEGKIGRANWAMPRGMVGVINESAFIENVLEDFSGFTNTPPRLSIDPNFMDPNGANAWAMAQEWSDPAFCEMWYDLSNLNTNFGSAPTESREEISITTSGVGEQSTPGDTAMTLFLRDRPFPTVKLGRLSSWFSLPTIELEREDIVIDTISRGGDERFNAFFLSPQITQELLGNSAVEITAPLWDTRDMLQHGFRRFDIMSKYRANLLPPPVGAGAADTSLLTLTKNQRDQIRDWHVMNPYLYSGTLSLGIGRPDARVGMRARISAPSDKRVETYYIEEVSHDWNFGVGIRTNLGVTRGWIGTDEGYMDALNTLSARYFSRVTLPATGGPPPGTAAA